jgi:hypothetical protein
MEDVQKYYGYIKSKDAKWVYSNQESILITLSMFLNPKFHQKIKELRQKYSIPESWYSTGDRKQVRLEWLEWHDSAFYQGKEVPTEESEEIVDICKSCSVDPQMYGYFVSTYFYYGEINPDISDFTLPSAGEFKFKARLEHASGDELKHLAEKQDSIAFIRFYEDTTINQLHEFIEINKEVIKFIQKSLADSPGKFPHSKIYGRFKRDLEIYLLHLMGNKTAQIAETLKLNIPDNADGKKLTELENLYELEDAHIRQIIKDLGKHVKQAASFKSVS